MPFPNQVNVQPGIGVAGDFTSGNPRSFIDAGPFGLVAGTQGVAVGRFVWLSYATADADGAPASVNNFGFGAPSGLIHREQQALITQYLGEATMVVPAGFEVSVMNGGDLLVSNSGSLQALPGYTAYANLSTGAVTFANGSSAASSASNTASTATVPTPTFTGVINGNILTMSSTPSGFVPLGAILSGTGVATGTQIVSQLTGTVGGSNGATYTVSIPEQTVAATTVTATYALVNVTGTPTGSIAVGGAITMTGLVSGGTAYVYQNGTGTGGIGTYYAGSPTGTLAVVGSPVAFASTTTVATGWIAASAGLTGELVKIIGAAY